MALKTFNSDLTTSLSTIYTCPAGTEASIHGLVVANKTDSTTAAFNLNFYKSSTATTTTLATNFNVGARKTLAWPKPINLQPGDYIQMSANANSTLVAGASVYEGSTISQGFNLLGNWNSATPYGINDVVTYANSSYGAVQSSTNIIPTTANSAYWQLVGSPGTSGYSGYSGFSGISGYSGAGYANLQSATSTAIGTGSKAFTVNQSQGTNAYAVGMRVRIASRANTANYMEGSITAYTTTSLTVNVDLTGGSGTLTDWNIGIVGAQGTSGYSGISGYSGFGIPKTIIVQYPTASENTTFFFTTSALTIANIRTVVQGTLPSVTYSIVSGANRSTVTTTHVSGATTTSTTTGDSPTIANASIAANTFVWLTSSAANTGTVELAITLSI